ncbi:MAG: tetratricopeptide repeat protein [Deltaproteobacteria bacterium]|nr:tetratricopeptide repeat protein [Deltaproteobacteria bacterium]
MSALTTSVRNCLILSACTLIASGCAENFATKPDVERVTSSLNDIRSLQATQTTQIAALENQMRQLVGRLEELEHSQNSRLDTDLSALKSDLSNLQRRVPPPAIVPAAALDEDEASVSKLPEDMVAPMGEGFRALRLGSYQEAVSHFKEAYDYSYGKEPSALAGFWLGVAYDGLGNSREALGAYHGVASRFPKNRRTPLALLRQGSVLVRMGDSKTAALTFKKIIAEFPKSSEAERAKERLKDLS